MAKHRVLLTGARGFVGGVVAGMAAAGTAGRDVELVPLAAADGSELDIRNAGAVDAAVAAARPTAIIHLAAVASPREARQHPAKAWDVNLMGTLHLAAAVTKHAPRARFIFVGSGDSYGRSFNGKDGPVGEDTPLAPVSVYGATKAAAEILLTQMQADGLTATRFRPFNHTGPGQLPRYAVPAFARQIVRIERGMQEPLLRVGNLGSARDFLDVRDVASAYLAAATAPQALDLTGAFNLSTGAAQTMRGILDMLLALSSASPAVTTDPALARSDEIAVMSGDRRKVEAALGWKPLIPLETTLRDVLDHWRKVADTSPQLMFDDA